MNNYNQISRSQWPRGLRRTFAASCLLRLRVRIPPRACMFFCCECCVLFGRRLRRADHASRGVLPTVLRRCVWSRNLVNEEALAHWRLSRQKQTNKQTNKLFLESSSSVSIMTKVRARWSESLCSTPSRSILFRLVVCRTEDPTGDCCLHAPYTLVAQCLIH